MLRRIARLKPVTAVAARQGRTVPAPWGRRLAAAIDRSVIFDGGNL